MLRLFVALDLPDDVRVRLSLLAGGVPGARWVSPEKFHLTLRFIGEVNEGVAHEIAHSLDEVRAEPFALRLNGLGTFGDPRKPRLLWAGVEAGDELGRLRDRIEWAVVRCGLTPDNRKFKPHVTLAHLRNVAGPRVMQAVRDYNLFATDPFTVDRFVLYSSVLGPQGSIYRPEARYDFGGTLWGDASPDDMADHLWTEADEARWGDAAAFEPSAAVAELV